MILGIAVLSLLLVLCLGATWTLDRTADQVASLLESAWISETTEEAAAQVAAAQKIWEQWLENVEEGFSDLQAWLQQGEKSEFIRTCRALAQQVRTMAESEKPYYYNIL